MSNSKALCLQVSGFLQSTKPSIASKHTTDDFADHFLNKIDNIHDATSNALAAMIEHRSVPSPVTFWPFTADEITRIVMESPKKQCSKDLAPTFFIKRLCSCTVLSTAVAAICNASFTEGVLPVSQKHTIVRPRLKKSTLDADDLNSYWPISNLTFLSKTIERVMATRFNEHADANDLLPLRQSAYRAHHSTETAVSDVHNRLVRNVDRGGHVSALVLLDLSSAFNTIEHAILLDVLKTRFGIDGMALKWYCSYLSNRTQTFQVGTQNSKTFVVYCSLPQVSILEALKFVVYTEDLPAVIE